MGNLSSLNVIFTEIVYDENILFIKLGKKNNEAFLSS